MRKQVIIYARVSTADKQDYNRQIHELTAIALNKGYEKKDILVFAESISGYKKSDKRPKLYEALNLVELSPSKFTIYTSEISRIGRNPTETRRIIDRLTDIGVPVYIQSLAQYTIDEEGRRNMVMNIILQVLIEYANLEAETFKIRSKSGLLDSARNGKAGGSLNHPYGYKKDEKGFLVVNTDESQVIVDIYSFYKKGYGIKAIAEKMNEMGVLTRMNKTHASKEIKFSTVPKNGASIKWSDKQIHDILRNPLYKGERRFKGELLTAPAIIMKDLWEECAEIMKSKSHRNYLTTYTYLLKDICECGVCARNYFAKYKPVKDGDKVYICSSRLKKGENCGNVGVNITLLESAIFNVLLKKKYISMLLSIDDFNIKLEEDIGKLKNEEVIVSKLIGKKEKENTLLLNLYLEGSLQKDEYLIKKSVIQKETENLNVKLKLIEKTLREKTDSYESAKKTQILRNIFESAKGDREKLKALFHQAIKKVVIHPFSENVVQASILMKIGREILGTIYIALDLKGLKKKPQQFQFKHLTTTSEGDWGSEVYNKYFADAKWITIPNSNLIII
jgi:site-specific DNA recombinase